MSVVGVSRGLLHVALLIKRYLDEKGYRWFTYRGLRFWVERNYPELEWHTVERGVRKLAELGLLRRNMYRKNGRRRVSFEPTQEFYKIIKTIEEVKV